MERTRSSCTDAARLRGKADDANPRPVKSAHLVVGIMAISALHACGGARSEGAAAAQGLERQAEADVPNAHRNGTSVTDLMQGWLAERTAISDHISDSHGIASLTYYEEQADPPEAHPLTNEDGYVLIAETRCNNREDLSRLRELFVGVGSEYLECDDQALECFYPDPDAGGGHRFQFRVVDNRLMFDVLTFTDGGYDEEGTARQAAWLEAHRAELPFEQRSCP